MRQRNTQEHRVAPALLDRLIDLDPDLSEDPPRTDMETVAGLRAALRRDLEMLLNTRTAPRHLPQHLMELGDSALSYGSGDFFSAELVTQAQRKAFSEEIRKRIEKFEPRLSDLTVDLVSDPIPSRRHLRLRIKARHVARPGLPPIVFETAMDPVAGRFSVSDTTSSAGGNRGGRNG
ncbi:type VI secretion system baseplate subunit TssE [Tateyamaria sp. ANG-S1]|uniref:type VI secretion system baseplate subunit TssE n=1 Tax=Tateyamaria sp. ANG-S1 TaxID=1577905 RepID=UPI00187BD6C6|nr:type VI secretion system baseplate subunit TssE [Tateyamaria sp. ANG-S1]